MLFRKRIQKDNITFHPNNTVSYREYRSYYFEPTMSVGNESDVLTIPNMLVLVSRHFLLCNSSQSFIAKCCLYPQGASVMLEKLPLGMRLLISIGLKALNEGPFLTKTVEELMWGYDSKLVDFLNRYLPGMLPTSGKFGLFSEVSYNKDLFPLRFYAVHTGQEEITSFSHCW